MACKVSLLFLALCAQSSFGCVYNGPVGKPVVLKSGYLADTHEVAAAKSSHLAALAKESHYGHVGDYSDAYSHENDYLSYSHGNAVQYHGPTAKPVVLKSGYLADTHEVAAAKEAHINSLSKQSHYGHGGDYSNENDYLSYSHGKAVKYHGPTAKPVVLKSGNLEDTHEVAAARGAHLAALAEESHYGHGGDYIGSHGYGGDYTHSYGNEYAVKYHGPTAIPRVLESGYLADTREVAAAKGAHLAAIAEQTYHGNDRSSGSYRHEGDYETFPRGQNIKYRGPTAIPRVLKNGHIADTHAVAAARAEHYTAVTNAKTRDGDGYPYANRGHE